LLRAGNRITGVELDGGEVAANFVVNAAGPWAKPLAESAGLDLPLRSVREQDTVWQVPAGRAVPKTSISMVGKEAFASDKTLAEAATHNAFDVAMANQEACVCSRFTFIEATPEQADRYCEILAQEIRVDRMGEGAPRPIDMELKDQIESLRMMDDDYAVFGKTDGRGVAIRSQEPVDFHPLRKTSNVVCVDSLQDAMKYVTVATQTVGVYPFHRMTELRDQLASCGAQRVVRLGEAGPSAIGNPHDAMYPLHRFVHWMANEDGCVSGD
jgi:hypothetical protein